MPVTADYITLQRAVADELGDRSDLLSELDGSSLGSSPIKRAIQSAIAKWEAEPFWFNEDYTTPFFTTVAGQELYGVGTDPDDFAATPGIVVLHILVGGNRFEMKRQGWQYLEEISPSPTARGQPFEWAWFANKIRLYPIPDGAYPVRASRTKLMALSADGDTNIWTNEGYDLIRSEAKLILARDVLHDQQLKAECEEAIYGNPLRPLDKGYYGRLKAETMRRAKSRIIPTQF